MNLQGFFQPCRFGQIKLITLIRPIRPESSGLKTLQRSITKTQEK